MRCLESIESQRYALKELIVVDDASEDGTREAVESRFPSARCLSLVERGGIGTALRAGSELASGEIWINLDDDALLASPDAAEKIAQRFAENPDIDVLCFRVEAPDGTVRRKEIPRRDKKLPTEDTRIGYFLGGAVAFKAESLKAVGGYPAAFRFGSWENDVAFRLFKGGRRILFTPDIRVIHFAIPSVHNTLESEANYVRNEIHLAGRYLPGPYAHVHALLWTALCIVKAAKNGHLKRTLDAVSDGAHEWSGLRGDAGSRLSLAETRELSRLSGRTWY